MLPDFPAKCYMCFGFWGTSPKTPYWGFVQIWAKLRKFLLGPQTRLSVKICRVIRKSFMSAIVYISTAEWPVTYEYMTCSTIKIQNYSNIVVRSKVRIAKPTPCIWQ